MDFGYGYGGGYDDYGLYQSIPRPGGMPRAFSDPDLRGFDARGPATRNMRQSRDRGRGFEEREIGRGFDNEFEDFNADFDRRYRAPPRRDEVYAQVRKDRRRSPSPRDRRGSKRESGMRAVARPPPRDSIPRPKRIDQDVDRRYGGNRRRYSPPRRNSPRRPSPRRRPRRSDSSDSSSSEEYIRVRMPPRGSARRAPPMAYGLPPPAPYPEEDFMTRPRFDGYGFEDPMMMMPPPPRRGGFMSEFGGFGGGGYGGGGGDFFGTSAMKQPDYPPPRFVEPGSGPPPMMGGPMGRRAWEADDIYDMGGGFGGGFGRFDRY